MKTLNIYSDAIINYQYYKMDNFINVLLMTPFRYLKRSLLTHVPPLLRWIDVLMKTSCLYCKYVLFLRM